MDRLGTCGVCEFYNAKVFYTDSSSGKCFVDYDSEKKIAWVSSRDTCARFSEHREMAVASLREELEELRGRFKGWVQQIGDCQKRVEEDLDLMKHEHPRIMELAELLRARGEEVELEEWPELPGGDE